MLKRIKSIQNVGKFKSCKPAGVEFGKLTFVYGLNTYGKSTLGDILSSLKNSNSAPIKARITIPTDSTNQEIELGFQPEGLQELKILYSKNAWQNKLPSSLALYVFDDGFYHNNLFAARQFTRATKEAFSAFILGEQGVTKAQEISEKNKRKGELTREQGKLKKNVFNDISDLPDFLNELPNQKPEELELEINRLRIEYEELKQQRATTEKILNRKEFRTIDWNKSLSEGLSAFNSTLSTSLKSHHEFARKAVAEHIAQNFSGDRGAETWIRQGLSYRNSENCNFCGQYLSMEALELFSLYEQNFDASYNDNAADINKRLTIAQHQLRATTTNSLKLELESNNEAMVSYPELENNEYYFELTRILKRISNEFTDTFTKWDELIPSLMENVSTSFKKKREAPNEPLSHIDPTEANKLDNELYFLREQYNNIASQLNTAIQRFKEGINIPTLDQKMKEKETEGKLVARTILRANLTVQCEEFIGIDNELKQLSIDIPRMNVELREEQSEFLKNYYTKLNEFFKKFGGEDFELSKGEDSSGHTPIFYLRVKFRGQDVSEKNLEQIFSESDRRALALSVFWAGVSCLNENEKKQAIVVLDDPVTSFDCNRMSLAHQEIFELSNTARQVIVLSHYDQAISSFLNTYKNQKDLKLISIVKTKGSSDFSTTKIDDFISDEHQKKREMIFKFIMEEENAHHAGDLRVFFEQEISFRFAQQIKKEKINEQNLSDRIIALKNAGIISESVALQADNWRLMLNPTHHIWLGNNTEDQRSVAQQFMNFIYKDLIPC